MSLTKDSDLTTLLSSHPESVHTDICCLLEERGCRTVEDFAKSAENCKGLRAEWVPVTVPEEQCKSAGGLLVRVWFEARRLALCGRPIPEDQEPSGPVQVVLKRQGLAQKWGLSISAYAKKVDSVQPRLERIRSGSVADKYNQSVLAKTPESRRVFLEEDVVLSINGKTGLDMQAELSLQLSITVLLLRKEESVGVRLDSSPSTPQFATQGHTMQPPEAPPVERQGEERDHPHRAAQIRPLSSREAMEGGSFWTFRHDDIVHNCDGFLSTLPLRSEVWLRKGTVQEGDQDEVDSHLFYAYADLPESTDGDVREGWIRIDILTTAAERSQLFQ